MAVYKDNATGTWRVVFRYTDFTGERKQTQKRGFQTKRDALAWEREQLLKQDSKLDMTFASVYEIYAEDKKARLKKMHELVDEAEAVLTDKYRDLDDFGRLLDTTWRLKKGIGSAVSTGSIDELYEKGMKAGALGGKLLGAGGGGFLVFYVQPEKQEAVKAAMKDLMYIPFKFEDGGTQVIYYGPEEYENVMVNT